MKILVLNSGSSSLRYELFSYNKNDKKHAALKNLYQGMIDRIGFPNSVKNYDQALKKALNELSKKKYIKSIDEIKAVGHRVVHGGEKYKNPVKITPIVISEIKKISKLAPLHNPANLKGINAVTKHLNNIPQVAVFDTAFHQTLEPKAYLYALPLEYYQKFGIRRYGFHGTSHLYVGKEAQKLLKKKNTKIITCHIGNGISATAVKNGKSIDTSMGFTPLEGLPMGTRCGDIDPAIVYKLMEKLKVDTTEIDNILNKKSGLKGFYRKSSDMRDIWAAAQKKDKQALFTIEYLSYKLAKYIGAYAAALNGLDSIAFTAGIGENAWYVRKHTCQHLKFMGVKIDHKKNLKNKTEISTSDSKIKIFVIPTDEEKEIAYQTVGLLFKK